MLSRVAASLVCAHILLSGCAVEAQPQEKPETWPLLVNPFPSTGGGGFMIDGYDPKIVGQTCVTDFQAIGPDKTVYPNEIVFDAIPTDGGTLCANGRWRAKDGSAEGTTPFQVFIKDGVVRRSP